MIVIYGNESLDLIFNYFNNATHISGYHGSLFANTMFCNENSKIVEFCSNKRVDYSFMRKYKKTDSYNVILLDTDDYNNVLLDVKYLKEFFLSN